jgi:hypothetical protein
MISFQIKKTLVSKILFFLSLYFLLRTVFGPVCCIEH